MSDIKKRLERLEIEILTKRPTRGGTIPAKPEIKPEDVPVILAILAEAYGYNPDDPDSMDAFAQFWISKE